jgi:tRNA G18 (ribose-2'-O)-methylase SpoU
VIALDEFESSRIVGVGPHSQPWPTGPEWDVELLATGDRRNVIDQYRYWTHEAIVADLERRRHPFHVAIENWQHDFNIGTVVRNANAFLANAVHIVGRRRWNRRGAMVTDRYQQIHHHESVGGLLDFAVESELTVVGIDLLPGSRPISEVDFPPETLFIFGQEGPGLSDEIRERLSTIAHIPQMGSTRSLNAGVASGIAMYEWVRRYAPPPTG